MLTHGGHQDAELTIGGLGVSQLKEKFQTPLYIIDQADLEKRMESFRQHFHSEQLDCRVIYASKAFFNLYMAGLVEEYGLYLDVVSGGELYTALQGGVDAQRIYFHGNHKSKEEIRQALEAGIGCFVIDNIQEYYWISQQAEELNQSTQALLRINPNITADTHPYIQTTTQDSKFGVSTDHPRIEELIQLINEDPRINFRGFHCHVGSQIVDETYFFQEAKDLVSFAKRMEESLDLHLQELNFGGGFGVDYLPADQSFEYETFLERYVHEIERLLKEADLNLSTISIEPGRSLINNSGYTLYSVGHVKETLAGDPLIFVDGGMSDNPRPSLYQAKYHAVLANKMHQESQQTYRVAGKLCESGDILIQQVDLPQAESGDLLLITATGAYTYSMSSNYNMLRRPALVFVKDGQAHLAVQAQSYEDLLLGQSYFTNQ